MADRMSISPIIRTESEIKHNAIIYRYPSGNQDIIWTSAGNFGFSGWEEAAAAPLQRAKPAKRQKGKKSEGDDMMRSMRRARAKLRRLALANQFDWFVTLTLDQRKIDRYDPDIIARSLSNWCGNMVKRHGLKYILVPERHKDGAYHFHGFFAGDLEVFDSGHTDSCGNPVYNLPQWTLGFSTAIHLYGEYDRAVGYVCKYIGKQDGERPMGRWYYSGGDLCEPPKEYADLEYQNLREQYEDSAVEFDIPGAKLLVIHTKGEENYGK